MINPKDIKPCPFCNNKGFSVDSYDTDTSNKKRIVFYYAYCAYCWSKSGDYSTRNQAIEAWNTRYKEESI